MPERMLGLFNTSWCHVLDVNDVNEVSGTLSGLLNFVNYWPQILARASRIQVFLATKDRPVTAKTHGE